MPESVTLERVMFGIRATSKVPALILLAFKEGTLSAEIASEATSVPLVEVVITLPALTPIFPSLVKLP